jgi:hypothetical protein
MTRLSLAFFSSVVLLAGPGTAISAHLGHYTNVGKVHFEVSCTPEAQEQFDYAVALLHSFFYPETVKAFTKVAELDPSCGMAFWGLALSYRQNPLVAGAAVEDKAWEAVEKAKGAGAGTERETAYITAVSTLFRDYDVIPYKERVRAYAEAMEQLAGRWPDDSEAQIFYALALNEAADLADRTLANQRRAGEILEKQLETHPDHPGIAHYIIHTYDYPELAERGLPAAKLYARLAPDSPHAKHMPSHIFSMLGMWDDLEVADESAAQAWYDYQQAELEGAVTSGELHSLDFLTYAYLQQAKDEKARQAVERRSSVTKFAQRRLGGDNAYAAIPMRYAIERGSWDEAAALDPVESDFPVARAISHFGRALGAARSGHPDAAAVDVSELRVLQQALRDKGDAYWAGQVEVQYGAATAWVMFAQGHAEDSLTFMRAAADLEDASKKHIAMENRLIPMRELLGDMLLAAGKPAEALVEYETSLKNAPNRFRSYYGAAKAAQAAGDAGTATAYFQKLVSLAAGGEGARVEVVEAKEALG